MLRLSSPLPSSHNSDHSRASVWGIHWFLLWLVTSTTLASAGGVPDFNAFLSPPEDCYLVPGDTIAVDLLVDETAVQFNGFEVTVQFDPDVLAFNGFEEGPLMINSCPTHFVEASFTDSTITLTHVLLCDGVSANGPGEIASFTFLAATPGTSAVEIVSDPDRTFLDAGLWIWPGHSTFPRQVTFEDTEVCVLDPTSDVDPVEPNESEWTASSMELNVFPHPVRGQAVLTLLGRDVNEPIQLSMTDAGGRVVWEERVQSHSAAHSWSLPSHGTIPAGVYYIKASSPGGERAQRKLVVID